VHSGRGKLLPADGPDEPNGAVGSCGKVVARSWDSDIQRISHHLVRTRQGDVSSGEHPLIPGSYQVVSAWRAPYNL
jgi:hypothetical protein